MNLGLYTDLYELRMVDSYLRHGMTARATFSLYIRATPERPWFVAFGLYRILELIEDFRFGPDEIAYLRSVDIGSSTLEWLESFEPSGEIWAVPDGTLVLANEPIVEVTAALPAAQIIETSFINLVHFSTLIATKAARIALSAAGRPLVDFGLRRAHGLETGVSSSLAAFVGGGMSTSNLEAGRRFGIPVVGTMAHSFVQAHASELEAFRSFAEDHPENAVLLVDTYDTIEGVRSAIVVADEMRSRGQRLRAIRIDSGDLDGLSRTARSMLDAAGHADVQIIVSGGLEESAITSLVEGGAPIDSFGVGTDLAVSTDRPAVDIAYKLVSYDGRHVTKLSPGKQTLPGAKQVFRRGSPLDDVLALRSEEIDGDPLLRPVWSDGSALVAFDPEEVRRYVAGSLASLPEEWRRPEPMDPAPVPRLSSGLRVAAQDLGGLVSGA